MNRDSVQIFTGSANEPLAHQIAQQVGSVGTTLSKARVDRFSDGEIRVEILHNVRRNHVFVIQSLSSPVNDTVMEMMLMCDALKRSSTKTITAVLPYYGYARQDRRPGYSRVPISARLVADMLQLAGVDHVVTLDLHATQIQGFFNIPVDNLSAIPLFVADIYRNYMDDDPIIVSPDVGGVARARSMAKELDNMELAIIDKRRPKANVSEVMNIIGDVEGRTCLLVDDIIDTAGTLGKAADALLKNGAKKVVAYCTHPVLSGSANANINNCGLTEVVVTNTIPLNIQVQNNTKIRVLSVAAMLAHAIDSIIEKRSISNFME